MPQQHPDESARRRSVRFHRRESLGQPAVARVVPRTRFIVDGHLISTPEGTTVADALRFGTAEPNHVALTLFPAPTTNDVEEIAQAWDLHPLLVEDLLHAGQRPKLERYGDVLFMVLRSARYDDAAEDVDFLEFHVLVRRGAIAVLCQDRRWIDGTDESTMTDDSSDMTDRKGRGLLDDDRLLKLGPEAIAYRLLDAIVDGYAPVLQGLEIDKEQIESQVFSGDSSVAERIYRLSQEVIDFQHTASSMTEVLAALRHGFDRYEVPESLQAYLQDVADHLARDATRVAELRDALSQILGVNSTLVAQRQNEDMKKISGWAAILFAPTLIGAIYGMNFDTMPELHWAFGYPLALGSMAALGVGLYVIFRLKKWM